MLNELNYPPKLYQNIRILNDDEIILAKLLLDNNQHHLFELWDDIGINDNLKHNFFNQIKKLHDNYKVPGGLAAYINQSKILLNQSKNSFNPLEGWIPHIPVGVTLDPLSSSYTEYEELGKKEVGNCGFILVAGGLGERLGYSGIKIELPIEMITKTCYLDFYCSQILNIQKKYLNETSLLKYLPFAIMVSDDTLSQTLVLLQNNNYFGLLKEQITILKQEKVASIATSCGKLALDSNPYEIMSKPHGHGDVHSLMYSSGTAQKWNDIGIKHCLFFQDTNALAFNGLLPFIGVSIELELEVNSFAVPRLAKQAMGGITRLEHTDGERSITINVEYNQLDPLLRATGYPNGDVNDINTGYSLFPGNTNQLLFKMTPYLENLNKTCGVMSEFVNPKYTDSSREKFKSPTRLECMMQDYPKILPPSSKVGFTLAPVWFCYSPCKNNINDAKKSQITTPGIPPACASSSESDQYNYQAEILRLIGIDCPSAPLVDIQGISFIPSPRIIIHPSCALFPSDYKDRFPFPNLVSISDRSSLVIKGNVDIISLKLDGALKLIALPGTKLIVNTENEIIFNNGYKMNLILELEESMKSEIKYSEIDIMRGYILEKMEEIEIMTNIDNEKKEFIYNGKKLLAT